MLGLKIENIICNTIFYFIFFFIIYFYIPNFLIKKFATLHFRGCRRWSRDQLFLSKKPAEITGAQKWWESRWKTTDNTNRYPFLFLHIRIILDHNYEFKVAFLANLFVRMCRCAHCACELLMRNEWTKSQMRLNLGSFVPLADIWIRFIKSIYCI